MNSLNLPYYSTQILSMRIGNHCGRPILAKPIFVLSIIDCIAADDIKTNEIRYTQELENMYTTNYLSFLEKSTGMQWPFFHLTSDGFYHIKGNLTSKSPTPNQLKTQIEYAYFDDALWQLLQNSESRDYLRQSLIKHYLQK